MRKHLKKICMVLGIVLILGSISSETSANIDSLGVSTWTNQTKQSTGNKIVADENSGDEVNLQKEIDESVDEQSTDSEDIEEDTEEDTQENQLIQGTEDNEILDIEDDTEDDTEDTTAEDEEATVVPSVVYNGETITYDSDSGEPFIDENNRTQVPFRETMEFIGATVSWNKKKQTATAVKNGIRVDVPIGKNYILKNDEKIINDTSSIIVDNRTYLPIRVVLEAFGCDVTWDQDTFSVVVTYEEETSMFSSIPQSYDLRDENKVTSIKDQLDTGACWAFASLGAMESVLMPDEEWDFSEDNLSLGHGFNLSQVQGGNYRIALSYLTRWSGPVTEEDDPFYDGIQNTEAQVVKHLQSAEFIPSKDYAGIKVAIMTYGGVQTSLHVTDLTFSGSTAYYNADTASYYYDGSGTINHDVVIVGWDDSYSKENFVKEPSRDGAFIAKNSYGTDFGDDGYFYISYDDILVGTQNIVYTRIDDVDNYEHIYQSDQLGYIGQIGYGVDTAYFANVYTSEGSEWLKAVSFYATDANSTYEVYAVSDYTDSSDLSDAELLTRGSFDYGGYYTVDLPTPIAVDGDYAVMVKITTPDSEFPIAAEYKKDVDWIDKVDLTDGEGFTSVDGQNWDDIEDKASANVCLKAFTDDRQ